MNLATPQQLGFNVELEPCPFCGSNNVRVFVGYAPHVTCETCLADGPSWVPKNLKMDAYEKQITAIRRWNRRS